MFKKIKLAGMLMLLILSGCSTVWVKSPGKAASFAERRAILTAFTAAVQDSEFNRAISLLTAWERSNLMGNSNAISHDVKTKLLQRAYSNLASDKRVTVIGGKISGIFFHLPMEETAPAVEKEFSPAPITEDPKKATLSSGGIGWMQ